MSRQASIDQHWDRERDYRKHEPRPSDLTVSQRCTLAKLIGNCEGVVASGSLSPDGAAAMRRNIAEALDAFGMPAKPESTNA